MILGSNPLIQVTPGLMIWTIVCFLITLFVLKRYAFGPVQKMIDDRRDRIRQSLDEADHAREEARQLLEEHRKLIASAQTDAEQILSEARRVADANERRMREELEEGRQRRRGAARACLRTPPPAPRASGAALGDGLGGGEQLVLNFLLLLADKGRTGSLEEIA